MSARFIIGDVRAVLASLEPGSVDLVLTSPPFYNLRSYLPSDDPNKWREIGSEPAPGEFIDTLLDVTEACAQILAPHGSLVWELGDTYCGSGGAGGDYADGGWRNGQPVFRQRKARPSAWSYTDAVWLAALIDAEGSIAVQVDKRDELPRYAPVLGVGMNSPAMVERAAAISGVGSTHVSKGQYRWAVTNQQARYVLLNIWPYLMVKQPQAKAAIELARHVEEQRHGRGSSPTHNDLTYRETIRRYIMNLNEKGGNKGSCPVDWEPPTPHRISHSLIGGTGFPLDKSLMLIPELYRISLVYGFNPLTGRTTPRWRARNVARWVRPNPPVGALGDKFRPATSELVIACKSAKRWFDLDAVRTAPSANTHRRTAKGVDVRPNDTPSGQRDGNWNTLPISDKTNPTGAPPLDWWCIPPGGYPGSHYAVYPEELCVRPIEAMCPRRVCVTCGVPSRRITSAPTYERTDSDRVPARLAMTDGQRLAEGVNQFHNGDGANTSVVRNVTTTGWTTCGCPGTDGVRLDGYHTGPGWRPGIVLDPFVGSGTTLAVAIGHSRDAVGIDLDPRNADLARERVGMFLEVDGDPPPRPTVTVNAPDDTEGAA